MIKNVKILLCLLHLFTSISLVHGILSKTKKSEPFDLKLLAPSQNMQQDIKDFLTYQKKLSSISLKKAMLNPQLYQKMMEDNDFVTWHNILNNYKKIIMNYQQVSSDQAHKIIAALQTKSLEEIKNDYYQLINTLTKSQSLSLIRDMIQSDLGFSEQDAEKEITKLEKLSLTAIRDKCIQYQRQFITQDPMQESQASQATRLKKIEESFEKDQATEGIHRKIPLIRNIEALLPSKITSWNDSKLYEKIGQKMKELGFHDSDVNEELNRLRNCSIEELQQQVPLLNEQLAAKLHYFDLLKYKESNLIKSTDWWLQQLHKYGTTAATIASHVASFYGYDPTILSAIASFALFDSNVTFSYGITKRDLLHMIYEQLTEFDKLKDVYINTNNDSAPVLSKKELLQKIDENLKDLNVSSDYRNNRLKEYQNLSKEELESLYTETDFFAHKVPSLSLSMLDKKSITLTKEQLLQAIKANLKKKSLSKDEIESQMNELKDQNLHMIKAAYLHSHKTLEKPQKNNSKEKDDSIDQDKDKSPFLTTSDRLLLKAPKMIAKTMYPIFKSKQSQDHKTAYDYLKERAMQKAIADKPNNLFDIDFATKAVASRSIIQSLRIL
ncbi:hypothetical protein HYV11_01090 [Candidatus Dependentiae bacterium]|nr:hypothetical protein [Candidatus Dependentiae bacterium]